MMTNSMKTHLIFDSDSAKIHKHVYVDLPKDHMVPWLQEHYPGVPFTL